MENLPSGRFFIDKIIEPATIKVVAGFEAKLTIGFTNDGDAVALFRVAPCFADSGQPLLELALPDLEF